MASSGSGQHARTSAMTSGARAGNISASCWGQAKGGPRRGMETGGGGALGGKMTTEVSLCSPRGRGVIGKKRRRRHRWKKEPKVPWFRGKSRETPHHRPCPGVVGAVWASPRREATFPSGHLGEGKAGGQLGGQLFMREVDTTGVPGTSWSPEPGRSAVAPRGSVGPAPGGPATPGSGGGGASGGAVPRLGETSPEPSGGRENRKKEGKVQNESVNLEGGGKPPGLDSCNMPTGRNGTHHVNPPDNNPARLGSFF